MDQANLLLVMDALDSRVRIESALDAHRRTGVCLRFPADVSWSLCGDRPHGAGLASLFSQAETHQPHFQSVKKLDALIRRCAATLNEKQLEAVRSASNTASA